MKATMRSRKEIAREFALALEFHRARMREAASIAGPGRDEKRPEVTGASPFVVPVRNRAADSMDLK